MHKTRCLALVSGQHDPQGAANRIQHLRATARVVATVRCLGRRGQEALKHGVDGTEFQCHLQRPLQPEA